MSSAFNIPAGWEHLKQYGYAPGNYMNKCHTCGKVVEFVDKRAITCRPCAEARHAAAPPVDAVPGEPVLCANCGMEGAAVAGDYSEEERFCSIHCREQHDELGCPSEGSHSGFRHPEEAARLIACESALRSLASYVGVGGYNAPTVDPDVFEEKIRWGIGQLTHRREFCPGCDMPQCLDAGRCAAPPEAILAASVAVGSEPVALPSQSDIDSGPHGGLGNSPGDYV